MREYVLRLLLDVGIVPVAKHRHDARRVVRLADRLLLLYVELEGAVECESDSRIDDR